MRTIRSRLIVIGLLFIFSVWQLLPKNETQRVPDQATGRMKDTTVRRVPVHLGLDLQGGVHLALEVDQTKGPVPDCAEAIRRAERVVRTRIDEFGTTEPVVQIVGRCRLIVEAVTGVDPMPLKTLFLPHYTILPKPIAFAGLAAVTALAFPVDVLLGRRLMKQSWHKVFVLKHAPAIST